MQVELKNSSQIFIFTDVKTYIGVCAPNIYHKCTINKKKRNEHIRQQVSTNLVIVRSTYMLRLSIPYCTLHPKIDSCTID